MIYTSYYGNLKNLPPTILPIAISIKVPQWYKGVRCKALAPTYNTLMHYKKNINVLDCKKNEELYTIDYERETLAKLKCEVVYTKLCNLLEKYPNYKDICLICYEKPDSFCHRHIIRKWFHKHGYDCEEFKKE